MFGFVAAFSDAALGVLAGSTMLGFESFASVGGFGRGACTTGLVTVDTVKTAEDTVSTVAGFCFSGGVTDVEGVELADVFTEVPTGGTEGITGVA